MLETPVWIQQGAFNSALDRLLIDTIFEAGVLDAQTAPPSVAPLSGDLRCTNNTSTMSVDVAPGVAVIAGTDATRQGKYVVRNTAVVNVVLDPRPATGQTRIDRVYAQVRDSSSGVGSNDDWTIDKVTGIPAGSPVAPALPSSAITLALCTVVGGAGAPNLGPADVVDARTRARTRAAAQGWAPLKLQFPGGAGSIVGPTGMIIFSIGPYPCKWMADITNHCLTGGAAMTLAIERQDPGNVWTRLIEDRVNAGASFASSNARIIYQQDNGAQVTFRTWGSPTSGGTGTVFADLNNHRVDALVHLCP